MKKEDMVLFAIVALGVFVLTKRAAAAQPAAPANNYNTQEIMKSDGWTYYTDGTSIDPQGRYYYQGQFVYNPAGMYAQ